MKAIFTFAMLAFAASAQADTILKYTMGASFEPNPSSREIIIEDNGEVTYYRRYFQKDQTDVQGVAQLSKAAIASIKSMIKDVPAKSEVKDTDPEAPKCSDFPPINITIVKNRRDLSIFKASFCHEFTLADHSADGLVEIAKAFFGLRYEGEETGSNTATKLIEYYVGMSLDPHIRSASVGADGNMMSFVTNPADKVPVVKQDFGRLSKTAIAALQYLIKNLDEKELKDTSPETPRCSDYPPIVASIWKDSAQVPIYRSEGCHEFKRTDWVAESLNSIAKGLFALAGI